MAGYEVGIIGAGIHGAAAAFHLASRGAKAVVFEKAAPAGGPTGRSSAVCRSYYTNEFLAKAARDSIAMLADFENVTKGGDAGFRRTGGLFMHPPEDLPQVRKAADRLNAWGVRTELLDPAGISARFPGFDLDGIGVGAWDVDAGYADPAGTTVGLLRRAWELGAETRLRRSVLGIEPGPHDRWILITSDGERTECERVLIAAGPWTKPLAAQVGADLPLTVERHIVAIFRWGPASPMPLHADLVGGYYFRPEGADLFLVGSLHPADPADPDRFGESITDAEVEAVSTPVVRRVPDLGSAEVQGGWASLYDVSPDWQPVIGEIAPGVFVDAGTSGHGFKLAPALGGYVADLVMGKPSPDLAQFDPRRFEQGALIAAGYGEAKILG
jgi:sarcosine oxidase subunit beta